jgi:hypothetical protein
MVGPFSWPVMELQMQGPVARIRSGSLQQGPQEGGFRGEGLIETQAEIVDLQHRIGPEQGRHLFNHAITGMVMEANQGPAAAGHGLKGSQAGSRAADVPELADESFSAQAEFRADGDAEDGHGMARLPTGLQDAPSAARRSRIRGRVPAGGLRTGTQGKEIHLNTSFGGS